MKGRIVSVDPGKHSGTVALGEIEAWFSLTSTAFPVVLGEEVEAALGKDSVAKPHARLVAPLDVIHAELHANGLMPDVSKEQFPELVMHAFDEVEAPIGLDGSDILVVLFFHYGESEEGLARSIRDRVLVFCDSHEVPELVTKSTHALAKDLCIEVTLPNEPDFNDVFDALRFGLGSRKERAFLLPVGHNETAILVRKKLARGKLRLFNEAESAPRS